MSVHQFICPFLLQTLYFCLLIFLQSWDYFFKIFFSFLIHDAILDSNFYLSGGSIFRVNILFIQGNITVLSFIVLVTSLNECYVYSFNRFSFLYLNSFFLGQQLIGGSGGNGERDQASSLSFSAERLLPVLLGEWIVPLKRGPSLDLLLCCLSELNPFQEAARLQL